MGIGSDDYGQQLLTLLPPGPAWEDGLAPFSRPLLEVEGAALSTCHERADALMQETDPRQTYELLSRWEAVLGLPDECTLPGATAAERRAALLARLLARGALTPAYFIALAESFGYPGATVSEFRPMTCDSTCDVAINPDPWWSVWFINLPGGAFRRFMTAGSSCDESLATWGDTSVECVIRRQKPAYTILHFAYGDA